MDNRWKFILPQAVEILRIAQENIIYNLRLQTDAQITLAPLIQRAYNIVNETGVLPYRDYSTDVVLLPRPE